MLLGKRDQLPYPLDFLSVSRIVSPHLPICPFPHLLLVRTDDRIAQDS